METPNLFQWILSKFELHIDDLSAKPIKPLACIVSFFSIIFYFLISAWSLWHNNDGAVIALILNLLCVLKGFCKATVNREIYRRKVRRKWNNCTAENKKFIEIVCKPYSRMFLLEFATLFVLVPTLFLITYTQNIIVPTKVLSSVALFVAFIGDGVDVLSDMYSAHPPMPPPTSPELP